MELASFQIEILERIIHSYELGKPSALIIMPAGTGKTTLCRELLQRMATEKSITSMGYVVSHKALQIQFENVVKEFPKDKNSVISSYTSSTLIDLINNQKITPTQFQFLVIDDVNELDDSHLNKMMSFFRCFKVGFSRIDQDPVIKYFPEGPTFKYTIAETVRDGTFLVSHKYAYSHFFYNLESSIRNIKIGTDWSEDIKQYFLHQITHLKYENTEYQKALELLVTGKIKSAEIIELSKKKEQLDEFKKLISDDNYFNERAEMLNGDESVWQTFFESNQWIFGFGLNYIFNSPLEGKKLEQIVEGYSIVGAGKRTDALMRSTGLIQTLCFGEIKTHRKNILKPSKTPYRSESWAISDEFAGGVAQIQATIQKSLDNIKSALFMYDNEGYKIKDPIFLYRPKSFLIIGSLKEFKNSDNEIHDSKFRSFELFRKSISDIEVITFDELFERAYALVNKTWI